MEERVRSIEKKEPHPTKTAPDWSGAVFGAELIRFYRNGSHQPSDYSFTTLAA